MKRTMWVAGGLLLALLGSNVRAQEFPVTKIDASGLPGGRAWVALIYDYGAVYGSDFGVVAEDLQFEYQVAGMTFMHDVSTIGPMGGAAQTLPQYVTALQAYASGHFGSVIENPSYAGSQAGYTAYALSFQVAGTPQPRSGQVELKLAFDILPAATPGQQFNVSFAGTNVLADNNAEFSYPGTVQHLTVTVVPEPQIAWMLLPGLALVGLSARRRADRQV